MTDAPIGASAPAPTSAPPAPAPQAAPAPATPGHRPSAPPNPRSTGYSPSRDTHARLREAQDPARGTYEQIRHAQDQAQARGEAPAGDQPAGDQPQPAAQGKVRVGAYEVSPEELGEMLQERGQSALRKATLPTRPEEYEAKLPPDLKLPGNQQWRIDANDPSLAAARNLAHAKGWSQQDFSEALGIFASHLAGQEFQLAERSRAELAKIGTNAPQRVDAAC